MGIVSKHDVKQSGFLKALHGRTPREHTGSIGRAPKDATYGDVKTGVEKTGLTQAR
jgi:hypothetical protein